LLFNHAVPFLVEASYANSQTSPSDIENYLETFGGFVISTGYLAL